MGAPDKNYRANPARSILVAGEINQQLLVQLTPKVLELRAAGSDPITVYIDSNGGSIKIADMLRGLLKTPDQDGNICRMVTVTTGHAESVAADLLATGDYAIAYPHCSIWYHGTRQVAPYGLTTEDASWLASSLRESNDYFAIRLADRAFDRLMMHFAVLRSEFETLKTRLAPGDPEIVGCFAHALAGKLTFSSARLLERAWERQREIKKLTDYVFANLGKTQNQQIARLEREIEILQVILKYEQNVRGKDWTLSSGGLSKVQEDFILLFDYYSEENVRRLERFANRWQFLFLSDQEKIEFEALPKDQAQQRGTWLQTHVWPKIHPLWYFVFSIGRLLQAGENSLTPIDAYWFGLVDEVLGFDLPNEREIVESLPPPPPKLT